jgi:murein peptide amidase A
MPSVRTLIIGGTHGLEPQSRDFVEGLEDIFVKRFTDSPKTLKNFRFIAALNPWGLENFTRGNKNGVDLNRNLASSNWKASDKFLEDTSPNPYYSGEQSGSEVETQRLLQVIEEFKPEIIFSFHTNHTVANPNEPQINFDGDENSWAYKKAELLSSRSKLPLSLDIGYPTPGSLGSYSKEKNIACITIEFDDRKNSQELWNEYSKVFLDFFFDELV